MVSPTNSAMPLTVETLRAIVEHASDALFVTDATLGIEWANDRASTLLGFAPQDLIGLRIQDLLEPSGLAREPIRSADLAAGRPTMSTRTFRTASGATRVLEVSATAIGDGRLLGIARDVTERVNAQTKLERSEASFRALIEASPDGVVVHRNGRIVYLNPAGARMLGASSADGFVGKSVFDLMHPDDHAKVAARITAMLGGDPLVPFTDERLLRHDGTVVTASVGAVQAVFEGEPSIVVVARDVTTERHWQEQLAQADRLASLGTLAAGVAHEINNPLAYVLLRLEGIARLAQTETIDARALREHAATAMEGVNRVARIVHDLSTLSRSDAETRTPTDVRRALELAMRTASHEIKQRARVSLSLGEVPPVLGNEGRLAQIFLNLLLNAAHAIRPGHPEENEIHVSCVLDGGEVKVAIRDSGAGISAEHLGRIFEPFFTTKPVGEGSGLGLSICHGLVTALGGRIEVQSEPGKGSTFTVVLPPALETSVSPPFVAPERDGKRTARARVLIVDDEEAICEALAVALQGACDVVTAPSALVAREVLERDGEFDAIVCDLVMPGMTGADLYRWILLSKPALAARVVFMSGGDDADGRELAWSDGRHLVQKPFAIDQLEALIVELADRGSP